MMRGNTSHPRVRKLTATENLAWYWAGNVSNDVPKDGEDEYLSTVLTTILADTPVVRDVDIVNPITTSDRRRSDRHQSMNVLLSTKGPFQVQKQGGSAADRILRFCLRDTELLEKKADRGGAEDFEVRRDPPQNSELYKIWRLFSATLTPTDNKTTLLDDLVSQLIGPPFGLSHQLIEVLIAAFLRNHLDDCYLSKKPFPASPLKLTPSLVTEAVADPKLYFLSHSVVSASDRTYLQGIFQLFPSQAGQDGQGIWENCKVTLLTWFISLPQVTRSSSDADDPLSRFTAVLQDPEKTDDAKKLLKEHLPEALEVPLAGPAPFECVVARLSEAKDQLDAKVGEIENRIVSELCRSFGAEGSSLADLDSALKHWFNGLTEARRLHGFAGAEAALKKAASSDETVVDRVLNALPTALGFGPYRDWTKDNTDSFVLRVVQAKINIDNYRSSNTGENGHKNGNGTSHRARIHHARGLILGALAISGLNKEEKIQVLTELLEEANQ